MMLFHLQTIFYTSILWIFVILGTTGYLFFFKMDFIKAKVGIETTCIGGKASEEIFVKLNEINDKVSTLLTTPLAPTTPIPTSTPVIQDIILGTGNGVNE